MKEFSRKHHVPIYNMIFEVVVCDSIEEARNTPERIVALNGEFHNLEDAEALVCEEGAYVVAFFTRGTITHNLIGHEVFHATLRIMERIEERVSPNHHEPHAYLCGFLTELVYSDLRAIRALPIK